MRARIIWWVLALLYAVYITQPILDVHFFRHLATGEFILTARELPRLDIWTVLGEKSQWIAQSWVYDGLVSFLIVNLVFEAS